MSKDPSTPTKITLGMPTISLGSTGISKEEILNKFMKKSSSGTQIVHTNREQAVIVEEKTVQEKSSSPYDNPYSSPYSSRPVEDTTPRGERPIDRSPDVRPVAVKSPQTTLFKEKAKAKHELHITLPAKVEIKTKKIEEEKHEEIAHDFSIFGTKPEGEAPSITIDVSKEDEVQKEDHRDKSVIDKHLRHYKYLEFDKESDIDSLKTGEYL
jgi:hypothetical protein